MEAMAKTFGGILMFSAFIIFITPFHVAFGWLAGRTVEIFFGDSILQTLAKFGIHGVTLPQLGMFFAFFGSFLRTQTEVKKKD